ncbi:MAG TPA: transcriptional repressor [Gillisia sp.]|nr:transcriptional repressor [Gillisia sp.]
MKKTEGFLIQKNVRPTAMRLLVYEFLEKQVVATSLTDIENTFDKSERTTLYRTLKTFEKNGLVHKIDDGSGIAKFALCEEQCNCELETDLHLHFHCTTCNETQCLTEQKIPHINLPQGFKAIDANLVVKGICNKCNLV